MLALNIGIDLTLRWNITEILIKLLRLNWNMQSISIPLINDLHLLFELTFTVFLLSNDNNYNKSLRVQLRKNISDVS